jgi:clan AA aspartic protease
MGNVFAEITLKNGGDLVRARDGTIQEKDIRALTLSALVDTGASTLVINEDICRELGLSIIDTRTVYLAGNAEAFCKITEPVQICWKNRMTIVYAWVLPGEGEALLGVIPLEDMDLIVDPVRKELTGAHGDKVMGFIKKIGPIN